ncbi:MAG: carbon-nitrogen hydrolase family protein [Planctomycetes bacterium]|nr:carbon-nitrogen hydrolase family protein [Planctomycetota bacterium]
MSEAPFKLGMAQILVEGGQPGSNLARAAGRVSEAAAAGCRLVVLPECLNLGWTHPSAGWLAEPIPGPHSDVLAAAARQCRVYVVAGLVERAGDRRFNAAVLISPDGRLLLHHRKINELDIALGLYSVGDRLGVTETELGTLGIDICADNFSSSLAIGHVLVRMGAQVLLSPSAWAVDADHDNTHQPYGKLWRDAYTELARLYDVTVVGVSNVGWLTEGPWRGRKVIGCSLAIGPGGRVLAEGPYGDNAEALVVVEVQTLPRIARGTQIAPELKKRGYQGP